MNRIDLDIQQIDGQWLSKELNLYLFDTFTVSNEMKWTNLKLQNTVASIFDTIISSLLKIAGLWAIRWQIYFLENEIDADSLRYG